MIVTIELGNTDWLERNELGLLGIKSNCFAERDDIEKVIVADGIGFIGEKAFLSCCNLTEVILPESMLIIDKNAFMHCHSIARMVLPSDSVRIGRRALASCKGLQRLCFREGVDVLAREFYSHHVYEVPLYFLSEDERTLYGAIIPDGELLVPDGVEVIVGDAFENDLGLKKVVMPDSVREIGAASFGGCANLAEVQFGRGLAAIGRHGFIGCSSLEKIAIQSEQLAISALAFANCSALNEVSLPQNTAYCDGSAFGGCPRLANRPICLDGGRRLLEWPDAVGEVEIPSSVKVIGSWAFCWCDKLSSVRIPDGVETFEEGAFCDCPVISEIVVPTSVRTIESRAFAGCTSLKCAKIQGVEVAIADDAFPPDVHVEKNEGPLVGTEKSVGQFMANRNEETYSQAVRDFVFEVMATRRRAFFPVDPTQLTAALSEDGKPLGTGIVRDQNGLPFLVFLTSQKMSTGTFTVSVEMVASEMFIKAIPDPGLAGVAINPWNDGGVLVPKPSLMAAMAELNKMFGDDAAK